MSRRASSETGSVLQIFSFRTALTRTDVVRVGEGFVVGVVGVVVSVGLLVVGLLLAFGMGNVVQFVNFHGISEGVLQLNGIPSRFGGDEFDQSAHHPGQRRVLVDELSHICGDGVARSQDPDQGDFPTDFEQFGDVFDGSLVDGHVDGHDGARRGGFVVLG